MQITREPRCPEHPAYAVYVFWPRPYTHRLSQQWCCAACGRPLGLASLTQDGPVQFPQGRKETPTDIRYNGVDWDWVVMQDDRREQGRR